MRRSVVRGLALCQGVLGAFMAYVVARLVRSANGVDSGRAVAVATGAVVFGMLHVGLVGLGLWGQQPRSSYIRPMSTAIVGVTVVLVVMGATVAADPWAAAAIGVLLLPMPVAILVLTRRPPYVDGG